MILASRKHYKESLEALRTAYRLNNSDHDVINGLARLHSLSNNPDSTIFYSENLIALDSGNSAGYYFLTKCFAQKQMPDSAGKYYDLFIKYGCSDRSFNTKSAKLLEVMKRIR
jgi:tetratricopeptide (TPR) repeat protein